MAHIFVSGLGKTRGAYAAKLTNLWRMRDGMMTMVSCYVSLMLTNRRADLGVYDYCDF
jgi:hypothetical protein